MPAICSCGFRGRAGALIKIIWHDGLGMSLYAKRLDRGRFIWPQAEGGAVALTSAQLGYMLEGNPTGVTPSTLGARPARDRPQKTS